MISDKGKAGRPRLSAKQLCVGFAMLAAVAAIARFDQAYLHAYTTKPLRGLEAWGVRNARSDALANIVLHNVSLVIAISMGFWIARQVSAGRAGGFVIVAGVFFVLFGLLAIRWSSLMLEKIGQT
jgi:hypothetical protein